ncbi:MAG: hypothetical protein KDD53_05460 [Bdellovibrionales bacterium]|nr:hypothetical protein [Bdellovibrionales bacterium]
MTTSLVFGLTDVTVREATPVELIGTSLDARIEILRLLQAAGILFAEATVLPQSKLFPDGRQLLYRSAGAGLDDLSLRALPFSTEALAEVDIIRQDVTGLTDNSVFHTAATPKFRLRNYGQRDLDHVKIRMGRFISYFIRKGRRFERLMLSTAWGDRQETLADGALMAMLSTLMDHAYNMGCPIQNLVLADTSQCATPEAVEQAVRAIKSQYPDLLVTLHMHPKLGTELEIVLAGIEAGVENWEAGLGGGGCPNATGAGANLDHFTIVRGYEIKGLQVGLQMDALASARDLFHRLAVST